jgi:hypothetical protein
MTLVFLLTKTLMDVFLLLRGNVVRDAGGGASRLRRSYRE